MSERKSWDIQPKRRSVLPQAPVPAPARRVQQKVQQATLGRQSISQPRREQTLQKVKPMPEPQAQAIRRKPVVPQGKDREPLKARRKRARQRTLWAMAVLGVLALAMIIGIFWLGAFRIQQVGTAGPDSQGMQKIAQSALAGTYHYVIPRNSIFFFPEQQIRAEILNQYPEISAVSISRTSLSTILISGIPREAALTWCGDTYTALPLQASATPSASSTPEVSQPSCYSADAQGVIFAPIADPTLIASTLRIYGALSGASDSNPSPLGGTIAEANVIPNALQFIKALKSLGVPIVAIAIRGDEADLYAQSGTRITYVLGHEEVTAKVAESAFPSLNLDDGSLEYVDLRFEGKAYFKKVGSEQATMSSSTGVGQ
jgi:hypothetical protein